MESGISRRRLKYFALASGLLVGLGAILAGLAIRARQKGILPPGTAVLVSYEISTSSAGSAERQYELLIRKGQESGLRRVCTFDADELPLDVTFSPNEHLYYVTVENRERRLELRAISDAGSITRRIQLPSGSEGTVSRPVIVRNRVYLVFVKGVGHLSKGSKPPEIELLTLKPNQTSVTVQSIASHLNNAFRERIALYPFGFSVSSDGERLYFCEASVTRTKVGKSVRIQEPGRGRLTELHLQTGKRIGLHPFGLSVIPTYIGTVAILDRDLNGSIFVLLSSESNDFRRIVLAPSGTWGSPRISKDLSKIGVISEGKWCIADVATGKVHYEDSKLDDIIDWDWTE